MRGCESDYQMFVRNENELFVELGEPWPVLSPCRVQSWGAGCAGYKVEETQPVPSRSLWLLGRNVSAFQNRAGILR